MSELLEESHEALQALVGKISPIINDLKEKELPAFIVDKINKYIKYQKIHEKILQEGDPNKILKSIKNYATLIWYICYKSESVALDNGDFKVKFSDIKSKSSSLIDAIKNRPKTLNFSKDEINIPHNPAPNIDQNSIDEINKRVSAIALELQRADERYRKDSKETSDRINTTNELSKQLESLVNEKIAAVTSYHDKAITEVNEKRRQLNESLGKASGEKRAQSYDESYIEEKEAANWLRGLSILFMLIIAIIVGYTVWETTVSDFKWENSAFRVVLTFFLTIPSAYLARESAKHRTQQYRHLQASLTLKTIDPYIASLPVEKQDEIKLEVASYMFTGQDKNSNNEPELPINTQEILMRILKKLEQKDTKKITKESVE